jgi:hypothetical protein
MKFLQIIPINIVFVECENKEELALWQQKYTTVMEKSKLVPPEINSLIDGEEMLKLRYSLDKYFLKSYNLKQVYYGDSNEFNSTST